METSDLFKDAFYTRDIKEFLHLIFPPEWSAISARIIESGATISLDMCPWAPRWSKIPPTIRKGNNNLETYVKSSLYRAHDCIHQLWGLPIPNNGFSENDLYLYKRAQMCGEVAVLTITEFVLSKYLLETNPLLHDVLMRRNALPMLIGPLKGRTTAQIAFRPDTLLHKKIRPKWVRDFTPAMEFCNDYEPMLEADRVAIDHNWQLMKNSNISNLNIYNAPNARYSLNTDGLELTIWMIDDFYHLLDTDPVVDSPLAYFNLLRRNAIILPKGWNEPK